MTNCKFIKKKFFTIENEQYIKILKLEIRVNNVNRNVIYTYVPIAIWFLH